MQKRVRNDRRSGILLCLLVLGVITALAVLPNFNRSKAGGGAGLIQRTTSLDPDIAKMWDIREDKMSQDKLEMYRQRLGRDASFVADIRDRFVRGEEALKQQLPTAKVEYNTDIRTPEVITPDVYAARVQWLSRPSNEKRATILREFIRGNQELIGVNNEQVDGLEVAADYTNPNGELSYAHLEQKIGGVPVFRGEVKAGFRKSGEIIRVINNLAPGLDYNTVSRDFGDAGTAVRMAADHIKYKLTVTDTTPNAAESSDLKVVFGSGDWATTAEKMYFPTEPGIAVPAWRVLIWQPVNAYYVIVDANTGVTLWHKNITDDQTQSATYNVYANPTAFNNVADHVAPLSPYGGPSSNPAANTQGVLGTRTNVTLIGNEGPNTFNQLGWINDNTNITDGNSNEAGLDRVAPNGVDAPMAGDGACPGMGCRVFSSTWNPPPGNPAPGDAPLDAPAQRGAVIQMFYIMNLHHDTLYLAGFTEAARNFQNTNFTGMGVGADRVSSEGQDSSGTNNANFATPADGGRGRMQMYIWTGPTPDRDGTADAHIVIHEVSHGVSNRLHGNGSGLGNQGGMMGEGWGDWYAHVMTAEPTDDPLGVHGLGGYSLANLGANFANNYYGIRRFPAAVKASTGGPNNLPHNPLTFGHLNAGCDTTLGTTVTAVSSAYPRSPAIATSGNCSQVHNAGEIWKNALWEVRGLYVARKGFTNGTRDVLQVVTDGMKLAPLNPMFLQERDAIIAAAIAQSAAPEAAADAADVREGMRRHGMGFSASTQSSTAVTEAFDAPTVGAGTASVTSGNNLLEPNECNTLNFTINNNSAVDATNISAVLSTTTPGITVTQNASAYPNMTAGQQGAVNITPFQVSIDNTVACYTSASFSISISYTGGGGGSPVVSNFSLPIGIPGNAYTFATTMGGTIPAGGTVVAGSTADDAAVAITLPAGWASTVYDVPVTSLSASTNGMLTVNGTASTAFTNAALLAAVGGTNPTLFPSWDDYDMDPADTVGGGIYTNTVGTAPNRTFYIEWRATHFAEATTAISTNFAVKLTEGSGTIQYINVLTGLAPNADAVSATVGVQRSSAAASAFTQAGFNVAGTNTPGLVRTGTLPAGQCTPGTGPCGPAVVAKPRADFDGDGKTDLSVFRPSEGNWYLQRSTAGFGVITFGLATDTLVPGDFDGDGKADTAVFRPDANIANNDFFVLKSNGFVFEGTAWGLPGDVPMTGDYDGDGKADRAVFRPSTGVWYILNSGNGSNTVAPFGLPTDIPIALDNDGDGKTNLAVYRGSENTWYIAKPTGTPSTNFDAYPFGSTGDKLVHADYDGDNKDDVAVFRPTTGQWFIRQSSNGQTAIVNFGISTDIPVPGDYDGDGKDDGAVYRNGTWHILGSTAGVSQAGFGIASDIPVPAKYLPGGGGGGGGAVTVSFDGATAIPDNNPAGVNINLPVTGVGTVADLNFTLNTLMGGTCDGTAGDTDCAINHTWVGDIIIKITPPDGSPTVTIFDRPGVPATGAGCSNNNLGAILLNDEGGFPSVDLQGNPTPGACNTALLFPTGNFSPLNPLSAFDGENADGTWVINVSDNAAADTGTVRRFSFVFNSGN